MILAAAACAPRDLYPERSIDPAPLMEAVRNRGEILRAGVSGTILIRYRGAEGRFSGKTYVTALPGGPFRLEIPGFLGNTLAAIVSDGTQVLAYYPEEARAFRSPARGHAVGIHLPFPLPLEAAALPSLILGVLPEEGNPERIRAAILNTGERILQVREGGTGTEFTFLFRKDTLDLHSYRCSLGGLDFQGTTQGRTPFLPEAFRFEFSDARIEGEWEAIGLFKGEASALKLRIPTSVPIVDLEDPL
ncbi:MAG: hypothetical protein JXR72_06415 [Proteobacteria bacterium]|nr:hypothetical protein [Pseudomonadota bacterium]